MLLSLKLFLILLLLVKENFPLIQQILLLKNWARVQNKHQSIQIPCTLKRVLFIYISIHQCPHFKFKHWICTWLLSWLLVIAFINEWIKHHLWKGSGRLLEPNVIEDIFCLEKYTLKKTNKQWLSFHIQLIGETLFPKTVNYD